MLRNCWGCHGSDQDCVLPENAISVLVFVSPPPPANTTPRMDWWKQSKRRDYRYTALPLSPDVWKLPRRDARRYLVRILVAVILAAAVAFTAISIGQNTLQRLAGLPAEAASVHRWERFTVLQGYYSGLFGKDGSGKNLKSRAFDPYPRAGYRGEVAECSYGIGKSGAARGRPEVRVFETVPGGMPEAVFGSHALLGLDRDVCFDRYGRLGPYGYGYAKHKGGLGVAEYQDAEAGGGTETGWGRGSMPVKEIDWRGVDWGVLQTECVRKNQGRFGIPSPGDDGDPGDTTEHLSGRTAGEGEEAEKTLPRTALLLRTWTGYEYRPSDIASIRSLIAELAINSGGEFTVYLLVHVKDNDLPIWASKSLYQKTLRENVPEEFWGIAELWSESMMAAIYNGLHDNTFRGLPLNGVYRSSFRPVQYFAYQHPEYEYVWNWEMDVRYIGHYYELFSALDAWAAKQPRKYLWERNERYYIPSVHGTWDNFSDAVAAISSTPGSTSVWGPVPVEGVKTFPTDPTPPFPTPEHDKASSWGVGEPADLIALSPIFDPEDSAWVLSGDTTGYGFPLDRPSSSSSSPKGPPRRTAIVAVNRMSRRLLLRMHFENALEGHSMCSEMWPPSVALQHGLKAVFAPHPVLIDRAWPPNHLERTFNGGQHVFGNGEHNFEGASWYYNSAFARRAWMRWTGGEVDGEGGEDTEREGGRMCLRSVLLHPVKNAEV